MWTSLCKAIEREDMLASPDFKGGKKRAENRKQLNAAIEAALVKKTGAEWIEILNQAGIPCGPIYKVDEVFADPQVKHLGVATPVEHKTLGRKNILANAAVLSRTPAKVVAPTPEIGEHTDEILRELKYSAPEIEQLRKGGVV
jgi:formyl-CoA transferase